MLETGTKAPAFELPDQNGVMHRLEDYRGKKVILYFYPKDNTPGCTKQACGYSERYPQLAEKGAVILGVSKDSVASHKRFEEKYSLAFPLLSDPERTVIEAYDVWKEKKLYGLTYYDGGTRCFYNTKKEIHSPEDMKGMLVRVQQSELMMSMVEALGGQSVATAYSEVYSALQTGVVDAAENSIVNYLDQSHFEVAPYFVEDHHTRSADILVMGEKSRGKLSAEDLKIIDDTALESWEYQKELWAEAEEESKQKLLEQDVAITELTEDELKAFQDACEPIWYSYEGGAYKDIIDQIVEAGK